LPPAWLRGTCLFLTALVGWVGSLLCAGHDPAFATGVRVAGMLTLLGMLAPGWVDEARRVRAERRAALRWVGALVETRSLPVLALKDGRTVRDTLSLSLLAATDLPVPIYEAAIGTPGLVEAGHGDSGVRGGPSQRAADDP
jgi:hypothetical protein